MMEHSASDRATGTQNERRHLPPAPMNKALADRIVADAIQRYFAKRRARIPAFVDRHFSIRGAYKIHKRAAGPDLLRTPANLALVAPTVAKDAAAAALDRLGRKRTAAALRHRDLFLKTDVARELEWLLYTDLLELPYFQDGRASSRDALIAEIMSDHRIQALLGPALRLSGHPLDDPDTCRQLDRALEVYYSTRAASADIATMFVCLGIGGAVASKLTPGMVSLGPAVAAVVAQKVAIASFPLGASLGAIWYGAFPAAPSALLIAGSTGAVLAGAAGLAAFSGMVTDPLQRAAGLHQKRLVRLMDSLEQNFLGDREKHYVVRDHYVARLADLFDVLANAYRIAS